MRSLAGSKWQYHPGSGLDSLPTCWRMSCRSTRTRWLRPAERPIETRPSNERLTIGSCLKTGWSN